VVLGLYVFLPAFGQAGISFLSFLTILPTYFGKMLPELISMENPEYYRWEDDMIDFWQDVPFFGTEISPSLFTLIMQGLILAALLVTAYRKWRNESLPSFSKTSGLIIFAVFQFLLLGSLWPFFSEGEASGLLGEKFSLAEAENKGGAPVILLFVQSVFFGLSLLGILTLVNTCCPDRHLHLKGVQRANRLGLSSIPMMANESRGIWFVLILSGMVCGVHGILLTQALATDLFFSIKPELTAFYLPSLLLIASALYLQAARELWFSLGFWGFVGLLWITPLLASLVLAVGWQVKFLDTIAVLSSFCPILCLPQILASQYSIPATDKITQSLFQGAWTGVGVACFLAVYLSIRLYRRSKE